MANIKYLTTTVSKRLLPCKFYVLNNLLCNLKFNTFINQSLRSLTETSDNEDFRYKDQFYFHHTCLVKTIDEIKSSFSVIQNFVTEEEENNIIKEVEPHLKRLKYEFNHWDDAIHGYREIERGKWSSKCTHILKRIHETSFGRHSELIPQVHVLDLAADGVIKPHVDSVRFCGNTVSGLCLLSDAIMRLVKEERKDQIIDVFLPRRALYIMSNESRYEYTHEILDKDHSYLRDKFIEKTRRVSVICRNPPS